MKINVFPPQVPDQVNLDFMVDIRFNDDRVEQFSVIASYKPDETNIMNAMRTGVTAELLGTLPLGVDLHKLTDMIEAQAQVWTPVMLQTWPQYMDQPASVRMMPKYGLILQKVQADALKAFDEFMADKQEFHVFYVQEPEAEVIEAGEPDITKLPEIDTPDGMAFLSRLYWMDHKKEQLCCQTIHQATMTDNRYDLKDIGLEAICQAADLIQYWNKTIKANN